MAFNFEQEDTSVKTLLEETAYHNLKSEFEKLGIDDVWKGGRKKSVMIDEVLEKLDTLKTLAEKGMSEAEAKEELPKEEKKKKIEIEIQSRVISDHQKKIYKLLIQRHVEDGVLDVQAVKRSMETVNKRVSPNMTSSSRQMARWSTAAHEAIIKDYK